MPDDREPLSDTRRMVEDMRGQWQLGMPQGLAIKLLRAVLALWLGIMSYIGVALWTQIDDNTAAIYSGKIEQAQTSTTLTHVAEELKEFKDDTKQSLNKIDDKLEKLLDR
jgi:hypothetical protein